MCKLFIFLFIIIAISIGYVFIGCIIETIFGNDDDDWMIALWPLVLVLETLLIIVCILISIAAVINEIIRPIYRPLYKKYVKMKFYKRVKRITKQLYEKGKIK